MIPTQIYLGGSEKYSNWRNVMFGYFSSDLKLVLPERDKAAGNILTITNTKEIDSCLLHFYCITPEDCGLHVAAELMRSVNTNPKGVVLLVMPVENGKVFTVEEKRELYILVDYVNEAGGVTFLGGFEPAIEYIHSVLDDGGAIADIQDHSLSLSKQAIDNAYSNLQTKYPTHLLSGQPKIYSLTKALNYFLESEHSNSK
jgi:hypothetical protein